MQNCQLQRFGLHAYFHIVSLTWSSDAVKEHYLKEHGTESTDGTMECCECEIELNSVDVLIMHIGVENKKLNLNFKRQKLF